jgi:uncharacterized surface anchored protein
VSPALLEIPDNTCGTEAETYILQATTSDALQRTINVISLWNDGSNETGKRPAMTIVELYRDEALYFTAVLNDSNSWMYSFSNLPEGSYKIKENEIPGYTVSYSVSGETVTVMHNLTEINGQQLPESTSFPTSVSDVNPEQENSSVSSSAEPSIQLMETARPIITAVPSGVPEPPVSQQNIEATETDLIDFNYSDNRNSKVMLLVGILGGAGILCAVAAIYLIRKMK